MNEAVTAVSVLHIVAGFLAFVVAPAALVVAKGGAAHPRWGKLYFWATALVAVTAIVLLVWRPAIFSFCSALAGYSALYRKRPYERKTIAARDWRAAIVMLSGSAVLFALGIARPNATWTRMSTIAIVLGLLGMALAAADFIRFTRSPRCGREGWFADMRGLLGSYVALASAFWAVSVTFPPLTSLSPSVVGVLMFVIWFAYYRARFARRAVAVERGPSVSLPATMTL